MTAQQLKNSILQMAVQGKLVPQNPDDEPASVLLERIKTEKEELIKVGKIKKDKKSSEIFRGASRNFAYAFCEQSGKEIRDISNEIPFDIPDSWEWCKVGNLFSNISGLSYKKDALSIKSENMIRVLRGGNILDGKYVFKQDDVFISDEFIKKDIFLKKGFMITPSVTSIEHIGKIALIDKNYVDTVAGGFVLILIPYFSESDFSKYLLYLFSSKYFRDICRSITNKSGQAFYNLSREKLMEIYIPLPPLAEQKRIVAKIEELLPYIEAYEKAETQLTALNTSFPEMLKKSILQEAVQGKLVPQNPDDEPASVLLERIRAEKQELIKQGKIKKNKNESVIITRDKIHYEILNGNERCIADEIPFDIPDSWCWCRLREIVYNRGQIKPLSAFCYIDIGSIDNERQTLGDKENIIQAENAPSRARKIVDIGDIIYSTVRPYLHNMCIIDKQFSMQPIASTGFAVMTCYNGLLNKYLFYYLLSPNFDNYANDTENSKGVAYPAINDDRLYKAFIPIPPLDEQKRIVEKIEELMTFCEKLK